MIAEAGMGALSVSGEKRMQLPAVFLPGDLAQATGTYALLNAAGMATAARVPVFEGAALPVAPPGWKWRLDSRDELPPF